MCPKLEVGGGEEVIACQVTLEVGRLEARRLESSTA
jgi:hypothetical protein